jgi:uncharacterized protein (UPF0335 family)
MADEKLDKLLLAVGSFQSTISSIENRLDGIEKGQSTFTATISSIENRLDGIEKDIKEIRKETEAIQKDTKVIRTIANDSHAKIGDVFELAIRNEFRLEYGHKFARSFLVADEQGLARLSTPRGNAGFKEYDQKYRLALDALVGFSQVSFH